MPYSQRPLDGLSTIVEKIEGSYKLAKHESDPASLAELLKQCEAALEQIDQVRAKL